MNKLFHITSSIKSIEEDETGIKISGYANTTSVDRVGDVITEEAWTKGGLNNYLKNPIVLFNHDYSQPIGKVTETTVDANGLKVYATVTKAAGKVYDMVKEGILRAFSVGFQVKDADYDTASDVFKISDLELHEISVVSVPANQDSLFSIAKSFEDTIEYEKFKKEFTTEDTKEADATEVLEEKVMESDKDEIETELNMTPEDLQKFAASVAEKTATSIAMKTAEAEAAKEKAAKDVAEKSAASEAEKQAIIEAGLTGAEKLVQDVEKRILDKQEDMTTVIGSLQDELKAKAEEIEAMRTSKMTFADRSDREEKLAYDDYEKAYFLSKALSRRIDDTDFGKALLLEKNQDGALIPTSASTTEYETQVQTNLYRDVQEELVIANLIPEIQLNAQTMVIPKVPEGGYATWVDSSTRLGATNGAGGALTSTGSEQSTQLTSTTLRTYKLAGKAYLNDEAEEDAILPILPIIRANLVRSLGNSIEYAFSGADTATHGGPTTNFDDLFRKAGTGVTGASVGTTGTVGSGNLLAMRSAMGVRGLNPSDLIYIVSKDAWYDLLADPEWQDANLVTASNATKLTGEVGSIYGSKVVVSKAFKSAHAAGNAWGFALNTRDFLKPMQRGMKVDSEYSVERQRRTIVATTRLGLKEVYSGGVKLGTY